jgi:hypothetical protein
MTAILIPPSHLKAYARLLKKANPSSGLMHNHILNTLCHLLGLKDFSNYERHLNKRNNPLLTASDINSSVPVAHLPLHELEAKANAIGKEIVSALSNDPNAPVSLPPPLVIGNYHLPSTPFDLAIRHQVDNLDKLPALRMSGVLYLLSLLSGDAIFDVSRQSADWEALLRFVRKGAMPTAVEIRLAKYEALNVQDDHQYHEGLFQADRVALRNGEIDDHEFVERVQRLLNREWAYLARARIGIGSPATIPPPFSFPLYEDELCSNYLALITTVRRLTSADRPILLGMPLSTTILSKWSSQRKALNVTADTLRNNLMILGMTGSGRWAAGHSLIAQSLMNNSGAVIVDTKGSSKDHLQLQNMVSFHNKSDTLTFLTVNHERELGCIDMSRCVRQSTVAHIMIPGMEMSPAQRNLHTWSILDRLGRTVPASGPTLAMRPFPYLVILNDVLSAIETHEDLSELEQFVERMNRNHVAVILSEQNLEVRKSYPTKSLARLFDACMLMCCENPERLPYTLDEATVEAVRNQIEGEFRYVTSTCGVDPIPYRIPYAVPESVRQIYLVMD